ncbi:MULTISPECIES: hypothetical protein [Streptomyces]|uniref:Uncharacterized protein n=1 Tax=Streptomyces misionensis TaxID=67331 RepID=A0A1H4ME56_9ACTN|nr:MULTISPECIES: hypothetical protein [Streptomyces]SEB81326.1 hypothetical protein SAMN04490357_0458 [Streptomyces misionensis]SFY49757.1 hypothetical protein STEPF1_02996 [Streptomyces sp. F-1]
MTAPSPSATAARRSGSRAADSKLLGIYLNDHLAGATAGALRAGHLARTSRGSALGRAVGPVAMEIAEDRAALLGIMRDLGVPVRRYKVCAGWAGERLGRLKGNGRLIRRSPLSTVLELEALRLGVEGKAAGWQTLRRLSAVDQRLDPARLDTLLERARRQQNTLEEWRIREAETVFGAAKNQAGGA